MIMVDGIKIYNNEDSLFFPRAEAIRELRKAPFGVFLEFIDPRCNSLVQKLFPFFFEPLHTYGMKSKCLITEYKGMYIYIPSDLRVYSEQQEKSDGYFIKFNFSTGILTGGIFQTHNVNIKICVNFRLACSFEECFTDYLSRS